MTTNNHPAHGPVSLDRLHQISEILSKAAAQSDGGNLGYAMADAVKVIDGAIAAFDAEPVLYAAEETLAYAKMGELHLKCLSQPMGDAVIPLYAHRQATDEVGSWNNYMNTPTAKPAIDTGELLKHIEGMEVSVDVSTCDTDAGHRYFGTVTEISELDTAKNGYILLVQDAKPNFKQAGNSPVIGFDLASEPDRSVEVHYIAPPGYVMVPKEMTDAIGEAIAMQANCCGGIALDIYDAMLAAAPQQEVKSALEHGMRRYAGAMQKLSEGDK
ncbi:hypothetical protein OGY72_22620 [Citrobacter sp. Cpo221]|uniref:hypothetical protein n=1 Tax=Citrobacter sp. Cpo221 TaxID=2985155 RepID=UPI0025767834|nr:hypothetical protein [Citrobacter sp. Cpo221]MDM2756637.1 hypothetical protein [Citrobacter sp. Cpo221]